jgi:ribosomal protein S24E
MERREVSFRLTHDKGTPTREETIQALAAKLKTEPSNLFLLDIRSETGLSESTGTAYLYDEEIPISSIEPRLRWKYEELQELAVEKEEEVAEKKEEKAEKPEPEEEAEEPEPEKEEAEEKEEEKPAEEEESQKETEEPTESEEDDE